jgi:hypothetical protein
MKPILFTLTALALAVTLLTVPWSTFDTWAAEPPSPPPPCPPGHGECAPPMLPPQTQYYGKTLAWWMERYWQWYYGGDQTEDHIGDVRFMPLPEGTADDGTGTYEDPVTYTGHLDVTLKADEAFVLSTIVWLGAHYTDGSVDPVLDPSDFLCVVTLDGRTLINQKNDRKYYFPVTLFHPPIDISSWGDPFVSIDYVQGIGFIEPPLSPGVHTLTLHSESMDQGLNFWVVYENTWTITVKCERPRH